MPSDMKLAVLDLATEDYVGLWEVWWRLSSKTEHAGPTASMIDAVSELIRADHVQLFRARRFDGDEVVLERHDALRAIEDLKNWDPPDMGAVHLRVGATADGEQERRRLWEAAGPGST